MKRVLLCLATLTLLAACQGLPYEGTAKQSDYQAPPWGVTTVSGNPMSAP
jgi:hypothetical protein